MVKNNGFGIPGTSPDGFEIESLLSKTNEELMEIMGEMLSRPAEEIDTDFVDACLDILQDRAPIDTDFDPAAAQVRLRMENPELFVLDEPSAQPTPQRQKRARSVFRYAGVLAATLLCLVLTANAFGFNPVQAFLKWVDDTIQVYSNPSGLMVLPPDDPSEYHSLDEALDMNGAEDADRINWVPKDFSLATVNVRKHNQLIQFTARYLAGNRELVIRIIKFENANWSGTTEREENGEIYIHDDKEYYIVSNYDIMKAGWEDSQFSYVISGQISEAELKEIINSVA